MEWLENLEHLLSKIVLLVQFVLEFLSVLCVVIGLIQTLKLIYHIRLNRRHIRFPFLEVSFEIWIMVINGFRITIGSRYFRNNESHQI